MKKFLLIQLILFLHLGLLAQPPTKSANAKWMRFDESIRSPGPNHKKVLGLRPQDELRAVKTRKDKTNQEHVRRQQYYQGIAVSGAMMITHGRGGSIRSANGHLIEDLSLSVIPGMDKETARNLALSHLPSEQYAWESEEAEQLLKDAKGDSEATFFPEGELVVFSPDFRSATAKLAYEFEIYTLSPHRRIKLFIDAHSGNILEERDLIHRCSEPCDVSGSGNTAYYGPRDITCFHHDNGYYLKEKGRNIETRNGNLRDIPGWHSLMPMNAAHYFQNPIGFDYENNSNNWGDDDPVALGVHWASEQFHDYMANIFGWNSYNNQGAKIINVVHFGQNMSNAFWNGAWASYGDGHDGNTWTSLDIVAHEISHALIQSTANLTYYGESGALNESFADIFAVLVEHYALGNNANWSIGEDITGHSGGLRRMSDFMEYQGEGWHNGLGDHGGVHTNSAVQNHWFYLLSNEIGMDAAARICFHSLTNYLTPHSNYQDAKNASIQAALDLFGQDTADIVCAKWNEVGLTDDCQEIGTITITTPLISQRIVTRDTVVISWEKSSNISHVNIEYLINSGTDWHSIACNMAGTSYIWNIPGFTPDNNVYIRLTNASNNAISDIVGPLLINECPANAAFTEDSNHTCLGSTISFSNISQNASDYEWWINGLLQSTNTDLQWTTDIVGESEIELRTHNAIIGCYNSAYKNVFVADSMNIAAAFTYRIEGMSVVFSASHPDFFANYTWDFGDGNAGGNSENSHTYLADNLYTVCLDVENDCGTFRHCEDLAVLSSEGEAGLCEDQWNLILNGNNVIASLETENFIWVGTNGGGLVRLSKMDNSVTYFNTSDNTLPNNNVRHLSKDGEGNIWVATDAGLTKHNGTDWENFNAEDSDLPSDTIHDLFEGSDGTIWIATENGLVIYNGTSLENPNPSDTVLSNNAVRAISQDINGNIWIGTDAGLVRYNGTDWNSYNTTDFGLIHCLFGDSSANIWISTDNGLVRYDGTDWEVFNPLDSSLSSHILEDEAGNIWVGSNGGLAKYDGIGWEIFNTSNSALPSNDISSLSKDDGGNIWIGTNMGLGTLRLAISPKFRSIIHCSKDTSYFQNKSYLPTQSEWRINGEIVSQEENLSHYFDEPGTYQVILIASNEDGCTDVCSQSINIPTAAEELDDHLPEYLSVCGSSPATIDLSSQNYASYKWTDSLGEIIGSTAKLTTPSEGLYDLTVVDSCGASATDEILVIIGEDCVWPGDTNKDGIVNHEDLIPIGLIYDADGLARPGEDTSWRGQASLDWNAIHLDDIDFKHADTNGDGLIDEADKEAILLNYGKSNTSLAPVPRPSPVNASYSLIPVIEGVDPYTRTVSISIHIQSNDGLYPLIYGLAFRLEYESPSLFDTSYRPLETMDIMGADAISVHRQFPLHTDIALVGTNHQNRNFLTNQAAGIEEGKYRLVLVGIGDVLDLPGGDSSRYLSIIPREVLMINNMGDTIPVKGEQLDVYLPDEDFSFIVTSRPVTCDSIGNVTIHPVNTTKSYSYLWDTGETSPSLSSPTAGIHRITVTDNNSDYKWEGVVDIQAMEKLKLEIEDDGTHLHVNVTGGDGNYIYAWESGETTASIKGERKTQYQVMVMDGNGCMANETITTLPIELLYFSGHEENDEVHLEWTTVSEENSSHFIVEHSLDGLLFQKIGQAVAEGHSSERRFYHFIHENPLRGANYYRLRMVDLDETEELSQIIILDFIGKTKEGIHALFPVPTQGNTIFLQYNSMEDGILDMEISDVSGRVISAEQLDATQGMNQFEIGIETFPKGIYTLNLDAAGKVQSHRFAIVE